MAGLAKARRQNYGGLLRWTALCCCVGCGLVAVVASSTYAGDSTEWGKSEASGKGWETGQSGLLR